MSLNTCRAGQGNLAFRLESLESRRLMAAPVLDGTFGSAGNVTYDPGPQSVNMAAAVQSDGKLLIAGKQGSNAYLARFDTDGSPDTSFGTGGIAKFDLGNNESFNAIGLTTEGKILVAGRSSEGGRFRYFLARYDTDGRLDTGTRFGQGDGIQMLAPGKYIGAMTIVGAKLFTAGGDLDRRNVGTGTLDTGFNTTGQVDLMAATGLTAFTPSSVAVSSTGKIALAGGGTSPDSSETQLPQRDGPNAAKGGCVVMLTSAGTPDNSFDANGVVIYSQFSSPSILFESSGSLDVATSQLDQSNDVVTSGILRFAANGTSQMFGVAENETPETLRILGSGKIVVASDTSATRFNSNGSLDTTFTATGTATASLTTFANDNPYGPFTSDGGAAVGSDGSAFCVNYFDRQPLGTTGPIVIGKFLAEPLAPG